MSSTRLRVPACSAPAQRKRLLVHSSAPCRQTTEAWGAGTPPVCSPLQYDAIHPGKCLQEDGERKIVTVYSLVGCRKYGAGRAIIKGIKTGSSLTHQPSLSDMLALTCRDEVHVLAGSMQQEPLEAC